MAKKSMDVSFDYSKFENDMDGLQNKLSVGLSMLADVEAKNLQSYMQENRTWTDRTGEAKRQLKAVASSPSNHEISITLSHGVNYGILLELENEKKYAILAPTANAQGKKVFASFKSLVKKVLS